MLLPIGHDSGKVRRHPWVTYALMAGCIAVFLVTDTQKGKIELQHNRRMSQALQHLGEHPYLQPPDALSELLGPELAEERRAAIERYQLANGGLPDAMTRAEEQAELDSLVQEASELRAAHPFFRFGLVPGEPQAAGWLGHMFLHGGWLHLFGNLLLLFLTAPFIEDRWGRPAFAAFYLASGLAAAGLFAARFPDLAMPLVGASGAIAGCMGAFLVRFFRTRMRYFYWFGIFVGTFSAPAWLMLPLWFGNELLMAQVTEAVAPLGGAGVAYWAHVGGFLFGAAAAAAAKAMKLEERFLDARLERKVTVVESSPAVTAAVQAEAEGRIDEAFTLLGQELRKKPQDRAAAEALWHLAVEHRRVAEAAGPFLRALRETLRAGQNDAAVERWLEFSEHARDVAVEPDLALRIAPLLVSAGQGRAARDALARALDTPGLGASLALRAARLSRELDRELCARAARLALVAPGAGPEERAEAEHVLSQLGEPGPGERPTLPPDAASTEAAQRALGLSLGPPTAGRGLFGGDALPEHGLDTDLDLDEATRAEPARGGRREPEADTAVAPDFQPTQPAFELAQRDTAVENMAEGGEETYTPGGSLFDREALGDPSDSEVDFSAEALAREAVPAPEDGPRTQVMPEPRPLRALSAVEAAPLALEEGALLLDVSGRGKSKLRLERVEAVAVAAVRGLGREKPVLVVDLVLNWRAGASARLHVLRLRGDRFDPRRLDPNASGALAALRGLVDTILAGSRAAALPDRSAVRGQPRFAEFADLAGYEREVLLAERRA
jgi:membrane associated rhomboid family serine protease